MTITVLHLIHLFALGLDRSPDRDAPDHADPIAYPLYCLALDIDSGATDEDDQTLVSRLCDDFGYHDHGDDFTFRALLAHTVYLNVVRDTEDYSDIDAFARDERDRAVIELVKLARGPRNNDGDIDAILCDFDDDDPSALRINEDDIAELVANGNVLAKIAARLENLIPEKARAA